MPKPLNLPTDAEFQVKLNRTAGRPGWQFRSVCREFQPFLDRKGIWSKVYDSHADAVLAARAAQAESSAASTEPPDPGRLR